MKKLFYLWMAIASIGILPIVSSCETEDGQPPAGIFVSSHYLQDYILPDSMTNLGYDVRNGEFTVWFRVEGELVSSEEWYSPHVEPHPLYDSLSNRYNDNSWNRETMHHYEVLATPVKSVSFVSDIDYGTEMPAGCNLCDYGNLLVYSLGDFILSGYKVVYSEKLGKPLKEYTNNEKCLWDRSSIQLVLPVIPSAPHHVTVTIEFEDGKSLTKTLHVEL